MSLSSSFSPTGDDHRGHRNRRGGSSKCDVLVRCYCISHALGTYGAVEVTVVVVENPIMKGTAPANMDNGTQVTNQLTRL